ncbi:MAG: glycoside hydrolase family 78 protein [bacterium]|nr:glycoside hydrolase family 78 protein [bacterium]
MITATNLQINHLRRPMGISAGSLRLNWIPDGIQGAWRVVVYADGRSLWDSGVVKGGENRAVCPVRISGAAAGQAELTLWDKDGVKGGTTSISFETTLAPADWTAEWIDPEGKRNPRVRQRASYLTKTFSVSGTEQARLYITAHGIYDVFLNGRHVDGYLLAPGNSQYDRRLQVQTYDVSEYLKAGENEIVITLGDGWYRGSCHNGMETNSFGTDISLLAELRVRGKVILKTDESWRASQNGALGLNDFMMGEEYDATREVVTDYHGVTVRDYGYQNLIGTDTVPVTTHETFQARFITTPKGEKVLDFGQNMAGFVSFCLNAGKGQRLILTHGEALDEDGNFTVENFQNPRLPRCFQKITYICKDGENEYHPTKCYMGFRYVKVEGDVAIDGSEFTAHAIYSDMPRTGFFICGNAEINQLFHNALWSMKSNFVDVPTDCPTREKSGYSGDLVTFLHTAMYLMDVYPVVAKWHREQAATQSPDGMVRQIAPYGGKKSLWDGGVGWCDSFELIPWRLTRRYHDISLAEETYDQIKAWLLFCLKRAKKSNLLNRSLKLPGELKQHFVDTGIHWGEWLEPGADPVAQMKQVVLHGEPEVATAYLSYGCAAMSELAEKLGKADDAALFAEHARLALDAYRHAFLENGAVKETGRQCRYVRPLSMGFMEDGERKAAADTLAAMIRENGNHLNTGFLTTHELCRVLCDNGHAETAYDLLLQDTEPSWLYPVKMGATTIPESWDGYQADGKKKNSLNHYSFGSIVGWLFDRAAGIVAENGRIVIQPYPDRRLGFVEAAYRSPLGEIQSGWRYSGNVLCIYGRIPQNAEAEVILPNNETHIITGGEYKFKIML